MSFERDGYDVRAVFSPAEITALQDDITAHIDRVAHALYAPFELSEPRAPFAERLNRVAAHDPSYANLLRLAVCTDGHLSPWIERMAKHPELQRQVSALLPTASIGYSMRLRASIPRIPEARRSWHSDVAIDDEADCSKVRLACWIPLMDAGPDSGGIEIVPGRRAAPLAHHNDGAGRYSIPDAVLCDLPRAQLSCPVGSVIFLDSFVPHRGLPNTSGHERWSLVIWFRAEKATAAVAAE